MAKAKRDDLKFDLGKVGMDDLEDFIAATNGGKWRDAAAFMAKCCVSCPAEWGAQDNPATFYKRPPVGDWRWKDLVDAVMETVNSVPE